MDYFAFINFVNDNVGKILPKRLRSYKIQLMTVTENYNKQDILLLVPPEGEAAKMEAGIYLETVYEHFLDKFNLQDSLQKAAQYLEEAIEYNEKISSENIYMTLVDTEKTKEFLGHYPHRSFYGMSVVYRFKINGKKPFYSCFVTNNMAAFLNMKEEELYKKAILNTKRIFPPVIQTLGENLYEMITTSNIDAEIRDNMPESLKKNDSMYIVNNKGKHNGAVYLAYQDVIEEVALRAGTDLYLLPSTIYDMYIVPVRNDVNMTMLRDERNAIGMEPEEKLTDQIYYYDYKEKRMYRYEIELA